MHNWSVLNDSIQSFLKISTLQHEVLHYIEWESMKITISNILRQLEDVREPKDLYSLAAFHQKWHSAMINRIFFSLLNNFRSQFGDFYIDMLMEVFAEAAYVAQDDRRHKEADYVRMIEGGFPDIFPELTLVKREAVFEGFRLDLLAKEPGSGRDVLFEVKLGTADPTPQLLEYAAFFSQPILIGITEKRLLKRREHADVFYFSYSELNQRAVANLRDRFEKPDKAFSYFPSRFDKEFKRG
ncbi:hypothetical protein [Lacrimispora celerecrescens]|uniref:Uncharacterized protein n=1 Tax=Lacrimispora celerecrescens TaxID=29354 RepID=A0A084JK00_9FIRM|nr:hypothetical protein [Lacrimispora celerecrescens]KEZ89284.1 hypothetical protein IO98_14975 [Lacrimispora celerecrescens]